MTTTTVWNTERQAKLAAVIRNCVSRKTFMKLMKNLGVPKIRARRMWAGRSDMTFAGLCAVAAFTGVEPSALIAEAGVI